MTALAFVCLLLILQGTAQERTDAVPDTSRQVVAAFENSSWSNLESGLDVIRAITASGLVMTAYRISPAQFEFSIITQRDADGSRVRDVGEGEGAVLATNAGFFAERLNGTLYPIGYLRLGGEVLSKGWKSDGGIVTWDNQQLRLTPTHQGIPSSGKNVLQSRPMLIEPDGKWAMGSNLGEIKNRTLLCTLESGEVVVAVVTRVGMSLYEAGWILRGRESGGFFGCQAALALDGGRSTQVWYSGDQRYSFPGLVPVHNFLVVRAREN